MKLYREGDFCLAIVKDILPWNPAEGRVIEWSVVKYEARPRRRDGFLLWRRVREVYRSRDRCRSEGVASEMAKSENWDVLPRVRHNSPALSQLELVTRAMEDVE